MEKDESFIVPTEQELIEWFGSVPVVATDGQYAYQYSISDDTGLKLVFSFDVLECSLQTMLIANEETIMTVVREGAAKVWLQQLGDSVRLCAECPSEERMTSLTIELYPRIRVEWASLRKGS